MVFPGAMNLDRAHIVTVRCVRSISRGSLILICEDLGLYFPAKRALPLQKSKCVNTYPSMLQPYAVS